jgi:hypothetical protein
MENEKFLDLIGDNFQIGGDDSESLIISTVDQLNSNKNYEYFVDEYFVQNAEFKGKTIPNSVKNRMVELLKDYDLEITKFKKSEHNDFFSLAYAQAIKSKQGGTDPIDAVRTGSSVSEWDFSFDDIELDIENNIVKENIKAAGALYNLYLLGDQLKMFALTDAVILKWWNGAIDVAKGDISNKMYRYYKLKSERTSTEEREMLYKRIFNMGDGKEMNGSMVNTDFVMLWNNLLDVVIEYIAKRENKITNEEVISRQPIFRAIREIQYNLSSSMTGIASISTREIYANYLECKYILGHKEVVNQVVRGKVRNINEVIRTLSEELLHERPNVSAYFTTAQTVQILFDFIANFNGVSVGKEAFEDFVQLADDYILNMELVNKRKKSAAPIMDEEEESDEDYDINSVEDEFEDF